MLASRLIWSIALVSLLMLPRASTAVESGGLSIYPTGQANSTKPWLEYYLAPGQTTTGSVTVDNRTTKVQDLLLYPVDAAPNGDGGFGMAPSYLRPDDAGQWIKLDTTHLVLAPGTTQQIGFNFQIPAHAAVGPHYGGIVVQPARPLAATSSGLGLHIITRLGVRLYETVPGVQRPHLDITALQHHTAAHHIGFSTLLRNSGNTILTPSGRLQIKNEFGLTVATSKFSLGREIKPDQSTATIVTTKLTSLWLPHRYHVTLTLNYGSGPHLLTSERTITFWTGHPVIWLIIIALGLLAVATLRHLHKRVPRSK